MEIHSVQFVIDGKAQGNTLVTLKATEFWNHVKSERAKAVKELLKRLGELVESEEYDTGDFGTLTDYEGNKNMIVSSDVLREFIRLDTPSEGSAE